MTPRIVSPSRPAKRPGPKRLVWVPDRASAMAHASARRVKSRAALLRLPAPEEHEADDQGGHEEQEEPAAQPDDRFAEVEPAAAFAIGRRLGERIGAGVM